jgi:hypothetical protein
VEPGQQAARAHSRRERERAKKKKKKKRKARRGEVSQRDKDQKNGFDNLRGSIKAIPSIPP